MLKNSVLFLIVLLLLVNTSSAMALAGNEDEAYEEAIEILSELKERGKTVIILDSSMDIKVPNIDLERYIQMEQSKVFTTNPRESRLLSEGTINDILHIYPELETVDLTKWTYARFDEYDRIMTNQKKEKPTGEQIKQLEERNITLIDADRLLREYWSYETLLEETDARIRERLIDIYLINLIAAQNLVVGHSQNTAMISTHKADSIFEKAVALGPRRTKKEAQIIYHMLIGSDQAYSFLERFAAFSPNNMFEMAQSAQSGLIELPGLLQD